MKLTDKAVQSTQARPPVQAPPARDYIHVPIGSTLTLTWNDQKGCYRATLTHNQ